jgi:acyl-CoA thioesterase
MTAASVHPLDAATALTPGAPNTYHGQTDPRYAHRIGPFGGITAATLLQAVLVHPQRLGDPIALTVNYAQPIAEEPFVIEAVAVRTNRSTQHWSVVMTQGDMVVTTASAVLALRRETWSSTETLCPDVPPPSALPRLAGAEAPIWLANYDVRIAHGMPLDTSRPLAEQDSITRLWVRDEPERPLDFVSLASICDVFVPRIMVRRPVRVPAGTVSLTTYFHAESAQLAACGAVHLLGSASASHFGMGFHDQSAQVWSPDRVLLATTHQMVYFKE